MGDNFHSLDQEETEQDLIQEKINLITITSAKNLENMNNSIIVNGATNITQNAQLAMTATSDLRTYTEDNRTLINTNIANIASTTSVIAGLSTGIIDNMNYFKMSTPVYYDMVGTGFGDITGNTLSNMELTADPKRIIINTLGIAQDTFSPNNFTFTESGTLVAFGWSSTNVLVFYKLEYYDNSAGERLLEFGFYDDYHNVGKFGVRQTVNCPSSNFNFQQISGFAGSIAIQNYAKYYFYAKSSGGGKIQGLQFFFVKSTKSF